METSKSRQRQGADPQQLRELEEDGPIVRTVYAEVSPRVEYSPSEMGASIFSVFKELRRWGLEEDGPTRGECSFCGQCIPVHGKGMGD